MKIADWPLDEVKIECVKCGLKTTLLREELEVVFGPDADLFSIRQEMTQACVPTKNEVCQSRLADSLLVQAIQQPDIAKVVDKSLLPAARVWRKELGLTVDEFDSGAAA
jgi:hypothetical protein